MQHRGTAVPPSISVSGSVVYASQGGISALDASSGIVSKQYQVENVIDPCTAVNDILYFISLKLQESTIKAAHKDSGEVIWSREIGQPGFHVPVVVDDTVFVNTERRVTFAFNAADGATLWSYDAGDLCFVTPPGVTDGIAYIATWSMSPNTKPILHAVTARGGKELWSVQLPSDIDINDAPVVKDGVIYMEDADKVIFALSVTDGSLLWLQHMHGKSFGEQKQMRIEGEAIYTIFSELIYKIYSSDTGSKVEVHRNPYMFALQRRDGALLWRQQIGQGTSVSQPAVAQGRVYAGTNDGNLSALRAHDGMLLWRYETAGEALSTPVAVGDIVYVGANDGCVYALRADNGMLLWKTFVGVPARSITLSSQTLKKKRPL